MAINEIFKIINRVYLPSEYSGIRERSYSLITNYKAPRYVKINDRVTALIEDAVTVWFQIEETTYLEGVDDETVLNEAIRTYAPIIPNKDEISLTLFIYIYNDEELRNLLPKYEGIERTVALIIDGHTINATPIYPEDYGPGTQPRSIHYLKFHEEGLDDKLGKAMDVRLAVNHKLVNRSVKFSQDQIVILRNSVRRDQVPWVH
ncbi:MAG: DUF3501 family protein [Vulcanisaeta sp. AZ3]|jgi:hypothetical protein|nr:MAG: hypothetical protein TU36_02135 [Vulcanisaeta sp. AZ3]